MNRNRIDWTDDTLEGGAPRIEEEVLGLTAKEFGRGFLGANHLIGKTLLNAFGAGAIVAPLDDLYQRENLVPDWASSPSIIVTNADFAVLDVGQAKPVIVRGVAKLVVYGGARFPGNGYMPGEPFGKRFTFGVTDVPRVMVNDGKKETSYTKVAKLLVCGGIETQTQPGAGGIASIVNVKGEDIMTDEELLNAAISEVPTQPNYVPPPPTASAAMLTSDLQRSPAFRLANARAASAQARLAAAKAKTPYVPTLPTLSPVSAPDLTQYMRSSDMDLNMDEILGEIDEVCGDDTEIVGGDWTEIVGDDYVVGTDVLIGAVNPASAGSVRPVKPSPAALATAPTVHTNLADGAKQTKTVRPATTPINAAIRSGSKRVISKPLKRVMPTGKVSKLKQMETKGAVVMNRAIQTGVNAQKRAKIALAAGQKATAVHGVDIEVLGAVAKPLTSRQLAAQAKAKNAAARAKKAAEKLAKQGDKAIAASKKLAAVLQKVPPLRAKITARPSQFGKGTSVRGEEFDVELQPVDFDVLGETFDVLDTAQLEVCGVDPSDPTYDPRFDDPNYSGDYGAPAGSDPAAPAAADPYAAPGATGALPGYVEETWTDVELPQRDQALTEDEMVEIYDSHAAVPPDAIYYHLERGLPANSLGSVSLVLDKTGLKDGFKFGLGRYRAKEAELSSPDWVKRDYVAVAQHEDPDHAAGFANGVLDSRRTATKGGSAMKFWTIFDEPQIAASLRDAANQSQVANSIIVDDKGGQAQYNWGPLVGHPTGSLKGLQFDKEWEAFFWKPEKAPRWSGDVVAMDAAIKEFNRAGREAVAEANRTNKAIAEQEEAERQRLQAQSDFDLSLQTDQATVQSAIFSDQLAQQQAAAQAQQAAMQTALDMQAQKADLSWSVNQQNLEQRATQADLDWAIANPDEAMAAQQQYGQQEQGYGDYGDEGYGLDNEDAEFSDAYAESEADSGADLAAQMDME